MMLHTHTILDNHMFKHLLSRKTLESGISLVERMNEKLRVAAVERINAHNMKLDEDLNQITDLASELCEAPIALLTLVDKDTQWIKVSRGFEPEHTTREAAFCKQTIRDNEVLVVEDSQLDERFNTSPLVTGELRIRFYAGAPLKDNTGLNLGSLCVLDHKPRTLSAFQRKMLKWLSDQAIKLIELKNSLREVQEQNAWLKQVAFLQSHQLRGPLTAVMGSLSLLKEENYRAPDEYYDLLEESLTQFDKVIHEIIHATNQHESLKF